MDDAIFCPIAIERECRMKPTVLSEMRARRSLSVQNEINCILEEIESLKHDIIAFMENGLDEGIAFNKGLINLKRDIFNNRYTKILKFDADIINNKELRRKVSNLISIIKDLRSKEAIREEVWETDYIEAVDLVRATMLDETFFYDAIKHIGFTMYDKLHKYCELPAAEHRSTQKKGNIPFIKLITRSALKPSPFASFVSVKPMIVNSAKTCMRFSSKSSYESRLYLNEVILLRIYSAMLTMPEITKLSVFALNDKVFEGSGYYDIAYEKDNLNNNKVFNTKATFSRVPFTEKIRKLYELLRVNGKADFSAIRKTIGYSEESTVLFIQKAIEVGLIYNACMVYSNSRDTFSDIINSIDTFFYDSEAAIKTKQLLLRIYNLIERYNVTIKDIKLRIDSFSEITKTVGELYHFVGISEPPANVVYEDLVDTQIGRTTVSEEMQKDLAKLCRLSNVFDINYRIQLYFGECFKQRFGFEEVPFDNARLMMLLTKCNQQFGDMWVHEWDTGVSRGLCEAIDRLDDMKDKFHNYLIDHKDDEYIEISDEFLDSLFGSISDISGSRRFSNDIFYQQCKDGRIVINNLYPGYMTFFGRHIDYFNDHEFNVLKDEYIRAVTDKENVTEIYEVYGFNANRHTPIFDSVIAFDNDDEKYGRLGFREIIKKSDITLKYNSETRTVDFYAGGRKRHFKEIGSLVTFLMKGEHSFLHNLCTNVFTYPQMFKAFEPVHGAITRIPEIFYKNIILSRRSYIFNTGIIPGYDKTKSETENYFNLRKWFSSNGIPMQFFIKRYLDSPESIDVSEDKTDYSVNKPQFIDLDNIILYHLFEKIISSGIACIISECQPYYQDDADENVREYIVEVTQ